MCYRDMTFCKQTTCANFGPCFRSLTPEVIEKAKAWWYPMKGEPWIATFVGKPNCYEEKTQPHEKLPIHSSA